MGKSALVSRLQQAIAEVARKGHSNIVEDIYVKDGKLHVKLCDASHPLIKDGVYSECISINGNVIVVKKTEWENNVSYQVYENYATHEIRISMPVDNRIKLSFSQEMEEEYKGVIKDF